jgi:hypothetical protein
MTGVLFFKESIHEIIYFEEIDENEMKGYFFYSEYLISNKNNKIYIKADSFVEAYDLLDDAQKDLDFIIQKRIFYRKNGETYIKQETSVDKIKDLLNVEL